MKMEGPGMVVINNRRKKENFTVLSRALKPPK
jgi:hypothetical protein